MKIWLDTEFIEDGKTIDLISIALVAEDGREYYAINEGCDFSKASDWVKEKVISQLPSKPWDAPMYMGLSAWEESKAWKSKSTIKSEVADFMGFVGERVSLEPTGITKLLLKIESRAPIWAINLLSAIGIHPSIKTKTVYRLVKSPPQIWGEYCAYDWVAFCQLFGRMIDLPKGMPFLCKDIVLLMEQEGLTHDDLPPKPVNQHNALVDARWTKAAWEFIDKRINSFYDPNSGCFHSPDELVKDGSH